MYSGPPAASSDDVQGRWSTREAHWRLGAQGFHWGLAAEASLLCIYQSSDSPKEAFSIHHIACTDNLSTESHSCHPGMVETFLKSRFPDASQQLALQAGHSKNHRTGQHCLPHSSPLLDLNSFFFHVFPASTF